MKQASVPVEQDLPFQYRRWRVERAGWLCLGALCLAGLAGLLGPGPLSRASAADPAGHARAEFDRFIHASRETTLRVMAEVAGDSLHIHLPADYLERSTITGILPEPRNSAPVPGGVAFTFAPAPVGTPAAVAFHLRVEIPGRIVAPILVDGREVVVRQFAFP